MKTVSYPLTDPDTWYQTLGEAGLGRKTGNRFVIKPSIGEGLLEYVFMQEGLWIQQMNVTLNAPLLLETLPKPLNDFFIMNFYLSNARIKQQTEDKTYEFSYDNVSVLLSSSAAASHYDIPPGEELSIFQIAFTKDWLFTNAFGEESKKLREIFDPQAPLCFSQNLDYKYRYILKELDPHHPNKLSLFAAIMQLMDYFFQNLQKRSYEHISAANIHNADLDHLMKVKEAIDANPLQDISLQKLAESAGMSLSKFKTLFKKVLGLSPYRYYLQNKMELAMGLLLKGGYSVAETAFIVGYSNPSQFAKAFKNQFGQLPSEIIA